MVRFGYTWNHPGFRLLVIDGEKTCTWFNTAWRLGVWLKELEYRAAKAVRAYSAEKLLVRVLNS